MVIVLHPPRELEDVWPAWSMGSTSAESGAGDAGRARLRREVRRDRTARRRGVIGHLAGDDPRLWFGYRTDSAPDTTDINAVGSWPALTERGYEPVRQIAIDGTGRRCVSGRPRRLPPPDPSPPLTRPEGDGHAFATKPHLRPKVPGRY